MKRIALVLLPGIVALILALVINLPVRQSAGQLAQESTSNGVVTMLASTIPVDRTVQRRVMELLTVDAPSRGVFVYAITDSSERSGYLNISVAGLALGTTKMQLKNAVWLGMVQLVADQPDSPGMVTDIQPSQYTDSPVNTGRGGSGNILPFRSGTTAQYGISGVHDCGFSLNGWKAVDFFPEENMIYSTLAGEVNYVCRDDTQVALRIGDNLYTHLTDGGQEVGDHYSQGQEISSMVVGEFSDTCGVAEQGESQYHVHLCFLPYGPGLFTADGYNLSTITGNWLKGVTTVEPLDFLTADWSNAGVTVPGAAAGGNVWDSTVGGVTSMVQHTTDILPVHIDMGIANRVVADASPALELIYTVILSNFNLTVPMWVMGIIAVLEVVRIAYAGWMWIKKAIPIIG